ncbi:hypothetical protein BN2497_1485 [Janthinobacterium sp. CG23_2]|nr:hypothetical protein BN2497_1485 [Janthinobacterium sp. CG23_2]CUU27140.1 hypothetical protein BN3177_1485 [Janthinobacterium sp. CG23_2]
MNHRTHTAARMPARWTRAAPATPDLAVGRIAIPLDCCASSGPEYLPCASELRQGQKCVTPVSGTGLPVSNSCCIQRCGCHSGETAFLIGYLVWKSSTRPWSCRPG